MEQGIYRHGGHCGVGRRGLPLGATAVAGGAAAGRALGGGASAGGPARFDSSAPADQSLAFRKLAYSTGGATGFWWLHGRRYGLVDGDLTPFWDMHVGSGSRTRDPAGVLEG